MVKMVRINELGYLCRTYNKGRKDSFTRDWWFVRFNSPKSCCVMINSLNISLPIDYIGKRVRFKLEILGEDEE